MAEEGRVPRTLLLALACVLAPLVAGAQTAKKETLAVSLELMELTPASDQELEQGQEVRFKGTARYDLAFLNTAFFDVCFEDQDGYPVNDDVLRLKLKTRSGVQAFSHKVRVPDNVSALRAYVELHSTGRLGRPMGSLPVDSLTALRSGLQSNLTAGRAVPTGRLEEKKFETMLGSDFVEFAVRVRPGTSQALFNAIVGRSLSRVVAELDAGAAPNSSAGSGRTALMLAAQSGSIEAVEVLLARGAKVNETDSTGTAALALASGRGDVAVIHALLKSGANVDMANRSKATPLMFAVQDGHADAASALLKAGADVNKKNAQKATPLLVAAQAGHQDVLAVLLEHGAKVGATNSAGQTALMLVAARGDAEAARSLLASGADVDRRDRAKRTALHWAVTNHQDAIAASLLDHGAVANGVDADRYTPLMRAARRGRADSVRALLASGADVRARNRNGESAAELAAFCGHEDVVALLGGDRDAVREWPLEADYDSAPTPKSATRPGLPPSAGDLWSISTVMLRILVDPTGRVARASVLDSVPALDDAALDCVRDWEFEPAKKNDQPVAAVLQVPVTFLVPVTFPR
jgi:TonB family protein